MEAEWTPRERNQEADDLSNLLTNHFDPSKEVQIELEGQSWLVLPALLQSGHRFQEQKELEIEQREKEEQGRKRMKRKKGREVEIPREVVDGVEKKAEARACSEWTGEGQSKVADGGGGKVSWWKRSLVVFVLDKFSSPSADPVFFSLGWTLFRLSVDPNCCLLLGFRLLVNAPILQKCPFFQFACMDFDSFTNPRF